MKQQKRFAVTLILLWGVVASSVQCFIVQQSPAAAARFSARVSVSLQLTDDTISSTQDYFIRKAVFADMGPASRILADGFFGDRDFFTYQIEKLRTYLSLESDFPKERDEHIMLVACQATDGKVVAVCDVDNRPALKNQRPYMCNLAVDKRWRGKGLAKALILECEDIVKQEWKETKLKLKARQRNEAAISLYKTLGYQIDSEGYDVSYMDHLVIMKKDFIVEGMNDVLAPAVSVGAEMDTNESVSSREA